MARSETSENISKDESNFPVVAIGASAGGLEAIEQFFRNMPDTGGMAFIVIQHLDPKYKGFMPEIIRKSTGMNVLQVTDKLKIVPDNVYVIPPNKNISVLNGRLHLFDIVEAHGFNLPIDFFFNSLADDMGSRAVGIILSGMGSDGSKGLKAIRNRSGLVLVQEPSAAKYDSMPSNAIRSVSADVIAPANELPLKLLNLLKGTFHIKQLQGKKEYAGSALEKIMLLVRSRTGHDFSLYKKSTIYRRVERRMLIHKIERITSYVRFLQENPGEIDILFKELLIGATRFFRDPEIWDFLKKDLFPSLLKAAPDGYTMRIWVPGCSTGEEAFSYAIIFKETLEDLEHKKNILCQIFASDLDSEAIDKARAGIFGKNITDAVSKERLNHFFTRAGDSYKINQGIREMIVFAYQNVISDPPFTRIDILSCRNLLIYHEAELQRRLLSVFHYSLKPDGILVLGTSETLGSQGNLYSIVNLRFRIFRKLLMENPDILELAPVTSYRNLSLNQIQTPVKSFENIQVITDNLILQQYSPAGILVDSSGNIIYTTRKAGKYIEPAAGKANMNIFSMLREGFSLEFPVAFRRATQTFEKVVLKNIRIESGQPDQYADVSIQQLEKPDVVRGMLLIVFRDVPAPAISKLSSKVKSGDIRQMEEEINRLRTELQNTSEAMQVSEEELKSANEELQSTNEELQSTNEELTTSKEELQSMNEELQTVNLELMNKVDELTGISNDMKNLLESTDVATLFLKKDLTIRRFTSGVALIFNVIEPDIGRPITDITTELVYDDFISDMKEVLRTLAFREKQIQTKAGKWFNIKIMPYRTNDDIIDGLVITFNDITNAKNLEEELNNTITRLRKKNIKA